VLDLEMFSRVLRLRWLWYQWVDPDRPWVGCEVPCSELDKQLFRVSTTVKVGDGKKAHFWESSWLNGQAPRDIAPTIYPLAWRKNNTVSEDLHNGNWMRGLWRMSTAEQMAEFVQLWDCLLQVQLTEEADEIRWRWTADGRYSSKSAYEMQFRGTYCTFNTKTIWRAKAEEKHRLFAWLLVQNKIPHC
jgi:hypothetical protein